MSNFVLSTAFLVLNIILVLSFVVLAIIALITLNGRNLSATPKAIWALIILGIPILGAVAFFIIKPEDN